MEHKHTDNHCHSHGSPGMGHGSAGTFLKRFWIVTFLLIPLVFANEMVMNALGLDADFDYKIFTDEFGREYWKPHSRSFIHVCKIAGVKPEEAVYIGDNPAKDFIAPNKLGMKSLRIRRHAGENSLSEMKKNNYNANFEIRSLNELNELLQIEFRTELVQGFS